MELTERVLQSLKAGQRGGDLKALAERHVMLDVPEAYLRASPEAGREGP
jgi:hypothetical protein